VSESTNISWCDTTVNPTSGCDGCELFAPGRPDAATCYAKAIHENRLAKSFPDNYAPRFNDVRLIPGRVAKAACLSDLSGKERKDKPWLDGRPRFIFVGDMADVFSRAVPFTFLQDEVFAPMGTSNGRRHFWIVLTKRPQRMAEFSRLVRWPANCIAMTSVTDQRTADARMPRLLEVRAAMRGVSVEPLLGPVQLHDVPALARRRYLVDDHPKALMNWIICGGESGPRHRDCDPAWLLNVVEQGKTAGVPTFVKQDSGPRDGERGRIPDDLWAMKQCPRPAVSVDSARQKDLI